MEEQRDISVREPMLVRDVSRALALMIGGGALYGVVDFLRPGHPVHAAAYYLAVCAVPSVGLVLLQRGRMPALLIVIAVDAAWTLLACAGLLLADNATVSGTAYILSLKWMASALIVPWPVRVQKISAGGGLLLYGLCWLFLDRDFVVHVHQWLLPPVAAFLSVVGARKLQAARESADRHAELLVQSEQRLQNLLDNSPDGMFVCHKGTIVFANDRLAKMLGQAQRASFVGTAAVEMVALDDRTRFEAFLRDAEDADADTSGESLRFVGVGATVPVAASAAPLVYRGMVCVQVTVRDTSADQRNVTLLEGERAVFEMIAAGAPLAQQLTEICRIIERLEPRLRTSILLKAAHGPYLVHGAAPSFPHRYVDAVDGLEIREGNGTCGTAAARCAAVATCDVASDAAWAEYRELARENGIAACWSSPILTHGGQLLGTFASYANEPSAPSEEWRSVVEHATHLARVALQRQRMEDDRAEQARIFATLADVGRDLISLVEEPVLLDRLCRRTREAMRADVSHVYLAVSKDDTFVPVAHDGDTAEQWEQLKVVRIPRATIGDLLDYAAVNESVEVSEESNSHLLPPGFQAAFGIHAGVFVALRRGSELVGAITAGHRTARPPFTEHQHRMVRGIAQMASLALSNSRLMSELESANRVKSNFVATMSHELRTPLNVLIGYQDLLLEGEMGPLNAEQAEVVRRLGEYSRQLLVLVNDTLDLSRLEAGRMEVFAERIDIAAFVERVRRESIEAWGDRNVRLQFDAEPGLVLESDAGKLAVVLRCLIGNAVKFTDGGVVSVRVRRYDDAVEFAVADTGIGIDPESCRTIFEPFTQAAPEIGAQYGGAGLGLYIVRRFLDLLGGTVSLESEPGVGSTFRVRFAARREPHRDGSSSDHSTEGSPASAMATSSSGYS